MILFKDGTVFLEDGFQRKDLLISEGKIRQIGDDLSLRRGQEIDCRDCYVIPGIIDMHVHTGEPVKDLLLAEDENMTAHTCLGGGVTSIGTFITETEKEPLTAAYPLRKQKFNRLPLTVRWHLTPVNSSLSQLENLFRQNCDLKLYTTYRQAGLYSSYRKIDEMIACLAGECKRLQDCQIPVLVHCEDNGIIEERERQIPFKTPFDHTLRRPEIAEIRAVEKVLEIAVKHNYWMHIVHVSSPESALLIKEAKKSAPVTCETAPHYLLLNETYLQRNDGHRWLCTPPLRSERSRGLMLELAQDGLFDVFATDHCPFTRYDKDRFAEQPDNVPQGLPGTGALLPVLYEGLVLSGKISFAELLTRIAVNPAKLLNLYPDKGEIREGADADLVILQDDEEQIHKVYPTVASSHNPWEGYKTSLKILEVMVGGKRANHYF